MATWMVHFAIDDWFINNYNFLDIPYFIVGSIAPDCARLNDDGKYVPCNEVTHLTMDGNRKDTCNYHKIYEEYIKNTSDNREKSFWIGYFVHLLVDVLWSKNIYYPLKEKYKADKLFYKCIREECDSLDFHLLYLLVPNSFSIFKKTSDFNEPYPNFYIDNEISKQQIRIKEKYNRISPVKSDYKYISMSVVTNFIDKAPIIISSILRNEKSTNNIIDIGRINIW